MYVFEKRMSLLDTIDLYSIFAGSFKVSLFIDFRCPLNLGKRSVLLSLGGQSADFVMSWDSNVDLTSTISFLIFVVV